MQAEDQLSTKGSTYLCAYVPIPRCSCVGSWVCVCVSLPAMYGGGGRRLQGQAPQTTHHHHHHRLPAPLQVALASS